MTGPLILKTNPAEDLEAATKQYVDNHMQYEPGFPRKPSTPIADGQEIPYTWEEINAITLAGKAQEYFSLGATKLVNLSTAVLGANAATVMVIGFNQDGKNTTTFQTKGTLPTDTVFGSSGVWIGSTARTQCQNFYNACEAKSFIKTVSKGTCPNQASGNSGTATYNDETVWIPSETEMGLDNFSSLTKSNSTTSNSECTKGYNAGYSYYTSNAARVKYQMNANGALTTTKSVQYWERSLNSVGANRVCGVRNDGKPSDGHCSYVLGFAPAFVIGTGTSSSKITQITQNGTDITDKVKELIASDTVLYTAQSLMPAQQTQARANINAAPGGYGLGEGAKILTASDNLNTIWQTGWYAWDAAPQNAPTINGSLIAYCSMIVLNKGGDYNRHQIVYTFEGYKLHRYYNGNLNTWSEWAWDNPPTREGIEFRTTELYLDKPVYIMAFSFGALPNASDKAVAMPGTDGTCKIIEIHGYASNEMTLPGVSGVPETLQVTLTGIGNTAYIKTGADRSSATATIVAKYIKTTD